MIPRSILPLMHTYLHQFRALCITGPRQSGKTTLSKIACKNKPYVNFENPSVQAAAEKDPEAFLQQYKNGAILDEVQRVPHIFRSLQEKLDINTKRGQFILTGSNNFLLQEQVSQSLAGRAGYISLLPLSYSELTQAGLAKENIQEHILKGGYPEIWNENLAPGIWMASYIQTYVQRDVRLLRNITNLAAFNRFIYLCASYAGQILNRDDLARKTGVDTKTIQAWLGLLENSYIVFLLPPWHNNLNKRIIKSPKLYFYDSALLCYLQGIYNKTALQKHSSYGAIVENWLLSEIRKNRFNEGIPESMYYFRDNTGNEIDLLLEKNGLEIAIEIKAGKKWDKSMLQGLRYWQKYRPQAERMLLYGGTTSEDTQDGTHILSWKEVKDI